MAESNQFAEQSQVPASKRLKKEQTELLALNDFCFLELFKYLPLNGVCALSQTCKRLYTLGSDHFMRNYKSKELAYIRLRNGQPITFPNTDDARYATCFARNIRAVTLCEHFSTIEAMEKLNEIHQWKDADENVVASPIESIRFRSWNVDVSRAHFTSIANILENVQSLTIENTLVSADLNDCFFFLHVEIETIDDPYLS